MVAPSAGIAIPGANAMRNSGIKVLCAVVAALCGIAFWWPSALSRTSDAPAVAYTRIYVENRCYHTVDTVLERTKKSVALPQLAPRETEIILFAWTKDIHPEETIRFSRKSASEKRLAMQELLDNARREQWIIGRHVVDSWFVTLCRKEVALDDPAGVTFRSALPGETLAEYEMHFSGAPDLPAQMFLYEEYPVQIWLDDIPLRILMTDKEGILRFFLPAGTTGRITLETASGSRSMELGHDWMPVRMRRAMGGEKVLVAPKPLSGPEDW
jgi:hypothetical protein